MKRNPKKLLLSLLHSGMDKKLFQKQANEFRTGILQPVFYADGTVKEFYVEDGIQLPFFVDDDFKIENR